MTFQSTIDRNIRRTTGKVENTFDSIKNAAYDGLHLGMGLVALVSENISDFVKDTVEYGEKVEKRQLRRLSSLQSDAAERVKGIVSFGKQALKRTENAVEDAIEEVVNELEIPKKRRKSKAKVAGRKTARLKAAATRVTKKAVRTRSPKAAKKTRAKRSRTASR